MALLVNQTHTHNYPSIPKKLNPRKRLRFSDGRRVILTGNGGESSLERRSLRHSSSIDDRSSDGGGGTSLNSVEHSVADLMRVNLEDLDAVVLGGSGGGGGGESLLLDEARGGGGLVARQGAVALGENGLLGERLDEARHHGVARALRRRPYAER